MASMDTVFVVEFSLKCNQKVEVSINTWQIKYLWKDENKTKYILALFIKVQQNVGIFQDFFCEFVVM